MLPYSRMKYNPKSEAETIEIGKKIAPDLKPGDIVCLYGDLGAGKTTLVKGLALGLGVKGTITSPTFTLMNVYRGQTTQLVHIDTYRLKNEQELVDIGVEDYLGAPDTICVIEWPEKIAGLLKNSKRVKIDIEHHKNGRIIEM
jgi:tRNA threonylcarbamoyladenosine biosynthesis protein TsaE